MAYKLFSLKKLENLLFFDQLNTIDYEKNKVLLIKICIQKKKLIDYFVQQLNSYSNKPDSKVNKK